MDELYAFAEGRDGLVTSQEARSAGIADSVLIRLAQRGRLERVSRGVYRISHYPIDRLAQYREAVLWAQASHGPQTAVISNETALLLYGLSDLSPARVHLTVPVAARLRRSRPKWIEVHHADLEPEARSEYEGIPVTTAAQAIVDVLENTKRIDVARQAIADGSKRGLLKSNETRRLKEYANRWAHSRFSQDQSRVEA